MSESLVITPDIVESAVALQRTTEPDNYRRTMQAAIAEDTPAFTSFDRHIYVGLCQLRGLNVADSVRGASLLSMSILMSASDRQNLSPPVNQELARSAGMVSVSGLLETSYQQKLQSVFERSYAGCPAVLGLVDKTMDKSPAERFGSKLIFVLFGSLVNIEHTQLTLPKARPAPLKLPASRQMLRATVRHK